MHSLPVKREEIRSSKSHSEEHNVRPRDKVGQEENVDQQKVRSLKITKRFHRYIFANISLPPVYAKGTLVAKMTNLKL